MDIYLRGGSITFSNIAPTIKNNFVHLLMASAIQGEVVFEAKAKIACPKCNDIPVIYDDVPKIKEINAESIEDIVKSTTPMTNLKPSVDINSEIPITVEQKKYAPHVISTPLAFLISNAMMTNIYGEPGWMGTGCNGQQIL